MAFIVYLIGGAVFGYHYYQIKNYFESDIAFIAFALFCFLLLRFLGIYAEKLFASFRQRRGRTGTD